MIIVSIYMISVLICVVANIRLILRLNNNEFPELNEKYTKPEQNKLFYIFCGVSFIPVVNTIGAICFVYKRVASLFTKSK